MYIGSVANLATTTRMVGKYDTLIDKKVSARLGGIEPRGPQGNM